MTDHPSALVSVPVEPTEAMIEAGFEAMARAEADGVDQAPSEVWSAMLAASTAAPQAAGVGELVGQIDALLAIPDENLSARVPYLARELLERAASHLRAPSREPEGGAVDWDANDQELIERGLRTIRTHDAVRYLREALTATTVRLTGYDWNADPDGVTKQQGDAFAAADRVFADLDAAVASHPEIELPECQTCGGTGKIEEAARMEGANKHSACIRTCDDCDGCGFAHDDEPAALATREEAPAEAVEDAGDIVRRWANWIIDESSDMDHDDHDAGKRKIRAERDFILRALRAQPPAREEAQPVAWFRRSKQNPDAWYQIEVHEVALHRERGVEVQSIPATPPAPEAEKLLRRWVEAFEGLGSGAGPLINETRAYLAALQQEGW